MSDKPNLALDLPLTGSRLIEASAGTGKTFTISALYVRLVLGHGGEARSFGRALLPPEILVVTFTEAATQELRDRIRTRLAQSARHFRGELADPDDLLVALRNEYPPADWPRCALRLDTAAQWMDEAAVSTIHSWCQRMLREHAFDSGCLFDEELMANETALRIEAAHDYWRQQVYPLQASQLERVLKLWPSVGALTQDAIRLLDQALPYDVGDGDLGELIDRMLVQQAATLARRKVAPPAAGNIAASARRTCRSISAFTAAAWVIGAMCPAPKSRAEVTSGAASTSLSSRRRPTSGEAVPLMASSGRAPACGPGTSESCMCRLRAQARYMSSTRAHQSRVASRSPARSSAGSTCRTSSIGAVSCTSRTPSLIRWSCSASRPTSSREDRPERSVPLASRARKPSAVLVAAFTRSMRARRASVR